MQKIKTFLSVFKNSLINLDYYSGLKTTSIWFSLKYLYLLLVITSLVSILPFVFSAINFYPKLPLKINEVKNEINTVFPKDLVITLKSGILSTNSPEPIYYKNFLVINPNAKADEYYQYKDKAFVLVTNKEIVYPEDSISLNQFDDGTVDYNQYLKMTKKLGSLLDNFSKYYLVGLILIIFIVPFLIAGATFLGNLISLLFFGWLVFAIIRIYKGTFSYSHIYKMAIHASTLPIIFFTILGLFNLSPTIPFGYSLVLGLFMTGVFQRIWKTNS